MLLLFSNIEERSIYGYGENPRMPGHTRHRSMHTQTDPPRACARGLEWQQRCHSSHVHMQSLKILFHDFRTHIRIRVTRQAAKETAAVTACPVMMTVNCSSEKVWEPLRLMSLRFTVTLHRGFNLARLYACLFLLAFAFSKCTGEWTCWHTCH